VDDLKVRAHEAIILQKMGAQIVRVDDKTVALKARLTAKLNIRHLMPDYRQFHIIFTFRVKGIMSTSAPILSSRQNIRVYSVEQRLFIYEPKTKNPRPIS
jgi:hypothetical protein